MDLKDAAAVEAALLAGTRCNREARCRRGSVDLVDVCLDGRGASAPRLIATGDLHDNPLHLLRLVAAAGMDASDAATASPAHLVLHELIHGDRLTNGMDFSYRVLTRAAALKAAFPEHAHTLLANHELAQMTGAVVVKDGVRCNDAFDQAIVAAFGGQAGGVERVAGGVREFIRSMPLALRVRRVDPAGARVLGDILCAHSLPAPELMDRFDTDVLDRDLGYDDYSGRRGSAYLMVWGRGHTPEQLGALAARWGVSLFILGHEKAESGVAVIGPNAVVLNSDHGRGVYWPIDLAADVRAGDAASATVALAS